MNFYNYFISLSLLVLIPLTGKSQDALNYDKSMAKREIILINNSIDQQRAAFEVKKPQIQNEEWIENKIYHMFSMSFEIKKRIIKTLEKKRWNPVVKKAFLNYYYNQNATLDTPDSLGVLQIVDFHNHEDFKNLLYLNKDIRKRNWVSNKDFSELTEIYSWYIWAHGTFYSTYIHQEYKPKIQELIDKKRLYKEGFEYYNIYSNGDFDSEKYTHSQKPFDIFKSDLELSFKMNKYSEEFKELETIVIVPTKPFKVNY